MSRPVISLLTDFGQSYYVGQLKGVLASLVPEATVIDLTHEIVPQSILQGAIVLQDSIPFFPPRSVHIAVVDPGVGTGRDIVAIEVDSRWIVGPNNGLLSAIAEDIPPSQMFKVTSEKFIRPNCSATFHGRDIMAPVAAHLSTGGVPADLGEVIDSLEPSPIPPPRIEDDRVVAQTLLADRYGNLLTNLRIEDLIGFPSDWGDRNLIPLEPHVSVEGWHGDVPMAKTYGDIESGQLVALWGSAGRLEVGCRDGSALEKLGKVRLEVVLRK